MKGAVDYSRIARIYDSLVTYDGDIGFFVDLARKAEGRVLELMAGTGRVALPIAECGVALTCVDSYREMLDILEEKRAGKFPNLRTIRQDAAALDLDEKFGLIFIAFNSFEELRTIEEREETLRRAARHLAPGGTFVVTLHDPAVRLRDVGPGRDIERRFLLLGTEREIVFRLKTGYDPETGLVSGIESFEEPGVSSEAGGISISLPLTFALIEAEDFRKMAESCGLEVTALYGDFEYNPYVAGESPMMVWLLAAKSGKAAG